MLQVFRGYHRHKLLVVVLPPWVDGYVPTDRFHLFLMFFILLLL